MVHWFVIMGVFVLSTGILLTLGRKGENWRRNDKTDRHYWFRSILALGVVVALAAVLLIKLLS